MLPTRSVASVIALLAGSRPLPGVGVGSGFAEAAAARVRTGYAKLLASVGPGTVIHDAIAAHPAVVPALLAALPATILANLGPGFLAASAGDTAGMGDRTPFRVDEEVAITSNVASVLHASEDDARGAALTILFEGAADTTNVLSRSAGEALKRLLDDENGVTAIKNTIGGFSFVEIGLAVEALYCLFDSLKTDSTGTSGDSTGALRVQTAIRDVVSVIDLARIVAILPQVEAWEKGASLRFLGSACLLAGLGHVQADRILEIWFDDPVVRSRMANHIRFATDDPRREQIEGSLEMGRQESFRINIFFEKHVQPVLDAPDSERLACVARLFGTFIVLSGEDFYGLRALKRLLRDQRGQVILRETVGSLTGEERVTAAGILRRIVWDGIEIKTGDPAAAAAVRLLGVMGEEVGDPPAPPPDAEVRLGEDGRFGQGGGEGTG